MNYTLYVLNIKLIFNKINKNVLQTFKKKICVLTSVNSDKLSYFIYYSKPNKVKINPQISLEVLK